MNRRNWFQQTASAASALGASWLLSSPSNPRLAAAQPPPTAGNLPKLEITDVRAILTAPAGIRLVVVKVLTNEPGLYGLGCATFTQRARAVETAVNEYLRPFLIGKNPLAIEDVWQSSYVSSYWRNGPVLNNALSGVDMALWDLLGKQTGVPVYQLLGGKCREAVDTYRHASGDSLEQVTESVRGYIEQGYRHVRIQVGVPGVAAYGAGRVPADGGDVPVNRNRTPPP